MTETKTTKTLCSHCGRPLADGLCRPEKLGFFCWVKGLQVSPENIIATTDSRSEHTIRTQARFDKRIREGEELEAEARERFAAVNESWLAALGEERHLLDDGGRITISKFGEPPATSPEDRATIEAVRRTIAERYEQREACADQLKRARIALHKLQQQRTHAGCRAELHGPGLLDRARSLVGA